MGPQPFWHERPISWKTIFPQTGVGVEWFQDNSSALCLLCPLFLFVLHQLPGGSDGTESAYNAGDLCLIPESGRHPGEGNGYLVRCSCPENSVGRETC